MTPHQFKKTLASLGLSKTEEAELLRADRVSIWRWKNGERRICPRAIKILEEKVLTIVASGNKVSGKKGR